MCGPQFADLEDTIWQPYRNEGLAVLGINFGETIATVQNFIDSFGITFPVLLDFESTTFLAYRPLQGACTSPFPLDFIMDAGGIIRYWRCEYDPVAMIEVIEELLATGTTVGEVTPSPGLRLALEPNWPNPFNPETQIAYELPSAGTASLRIFDAEGRLVRVLATGHHDAGRHTLTWNGLNTNGQPVASGTYMCRLSTPTSTAAQKLTLIR